MEQSNIKRLIKMSQFPIQQSQDPISRYHQTIHTGTEQEQQEGYSNDCVDYAKELSSVTDRGHMAISDCRYNCCGKE